MTKFFCDRCDEQTDQLTSVTIPSAGNCPSKIVELCRRCVADLHDRTRPMAKAAPEHRR